MDDDTTRDQQPDDAASGFLQRATPFLRNVSDALDRNPELRETRDAIIRGARERLSTGADELVRRADDALARATAVEGTVVDVEPATAPGTDADAGAATTGADPRARTTFRASSPSSAGPRTSTTPHWTHGRLARMALAAAREAARPARAPRWSMRAPAGAALAVGLLLVVLGRRAARGRRRH